MGDVFSLIWVKTTTVCCSLWSRAGKHVNKRTPMLTFEESAGVKSTLHVWAGRRTVSLRKARLLDLGTSGLDIVHLQHGHDHRQDEPRFGSQT